MRHASAVHGMCVICTCGVLLLLFIITLCHRRHRVVASPSSLRHCAGLLSPTCVARLRHLCDGVLSLESLADDSDVFRLVPDQTRWGAEATGLCGRDVTESNGWKG